MNNIERETIKKTVFGIVSNVLEIDSEAITEDMELDADLKIDSLALYEIVVDIEEMYSLRISNDEAEDLRTVGEAIDFIVQRVREA